MSSFIPMSGLVSCPGNCSGNGVCLGGHCLCQVQYSGQLCETQNADYFLAFAILFYIICATAITQLILCIRSDFRNLKRPNPWAMFTPTIQKLLYVSIIFASIARAVYFTLHFLDLFTEGYWKESLFSSYYPFILSSFSLIVCFWAESFHLTGLQLDRPRFLTKSIVGFAVFNTLFYVTLFAQYVAANLSHGSWPFETKMTEVFNAFFAFLMFVVLLFFLIYGVELFYKLEGEFKPGGMSQQVHGDEVDSVQLCQSRFGLLAQATFLLAASMLLTGEVVGPMWKDRISVSELNVLDVTFRLIELAIVIWFVCCLWNVNRPGELWILNPQKLLLFRRHNKEVTESLQPTTAPESSTTSENTFEESTNIDASGTFECAICYDPDKTDGGALIRACNCKGDIGIVHHECLKRWLVEISANASLEEAPTCKVCHGEYHISQNSTCIWLPSGIKVRTWTQTMLVSLMMAAMPVTLFFTWDMIPHAAIKLGCAGLIMLAEYVLLRLLGFSFIRAYKSMRVHASRIMGRPVVAETNNVAPATTAPLTGSSSVISVADTTVLRHQALVIPATNV